MRLGRVQHVHLVGIGGSGMSGIAEVLIREGFKVSGSDQQSNETTLRLKILGCKIYIGHEASQVEGADVLVYSTAVPTKNPERKQAEKLGIPCIRRGEMLAELMRLKVGVAVAGAHGKTTTTTMVGLVMDAAGFDPTVVVGGKIFGVDGNTIPGRSEYMVAEADESDGSFLLLSHSFGVVTNIDREHLDYYGTEQAVYDAFCQFMNEVPFWGAVVVCADDAGLMRLLPNVNRRVRTYGFSHSAEVRGEILESSLEGSLFRVYEGENSFEVQLNVPGQHNVLNALAAITLGLELGAAPAQVVEGLGRYRGIHRRLEKKFASECLSLYDDYAHHPTEIKATLATFKNETNLPICAVFQPHRYTRTAEHWNEFGAAFEDADIVYLLPIYAAGEASGNGIESLRLVKEMQQQTGRDIRYLDAPDCATVLEAAQHGILVTLGAGSITQFAKELALVLEKAD